MIEQSEKKQQSLFGSDKEAARQARSALRWATWRFSPGLDALRASIFDPALREVDSPKIVEQFWVKKGQAFQKRVSQRIMRYYTPLEELALPPAPDVARRERLTAYLNDPESIDVCDPSLSTSLAIKRLYAAMSQGGLRFILVLTKFQDLRNVPGSNFAVAMHPHGLEFLMKDSDGKMTLVDSSLEKAFWSRLVTAGVGYKDIKDSFEIAAKMFALMTQGYKDNSFVAELGALEPQSMSAYHQSDLATAHKLFGTKDQLNRAFYKQLLSTELNTAQGKSSNFLDFLFSNQ